MKEKFINIHHQTFVKKMNLKKKFQLLGMQEIFIFGFQICGMEEILNFSNKETCILMGDLENFNSNKSSL